MERCVELSRYFFAMASLKLALSGYTEPAHYLPGSGRIVGNCCEPAGPMTEVQPGI